MVSHPTVSLNNDKVCVDAKEGADSAIATGRIEPIGQVAAHRAGAIRIETRVAPN